MRYFISDDGLTLIKVTGSDVEIPGMKPISVWKYRALKSKGFASSLVDVSKSKVKTVNKVAVKAAIIVKDKTVKVKNALIE